MSTHGVAIEVKDVTRVHEKGRTTLRVLDSVSFGVGAGEMVAVVGPSGSGKSTLMHLLGLLDRPTSGSIHLDGVDVAGLSGRKLAQIRNRRIGFVFQAHHLLPEHTALANVMMPVRLSGSPVRLAEDRARALLGAVGLEARLDHKPGELSGGEQQRVALARAMVMGPGLILADEPTGNLDPTTASGVFDLMLQLNTTLGSTLLVVTHSMELAELFPRKLRLAGGKVLEG
ncbi:MAG: ABC transporter ATP-binding protein [Alphaproteobacteria bacterium]|nr:ABC transporter ATP-binding protein [Alphaproteobacteria bacterium]